MPNGPADAPIAVGRPYGIFFSFFFFFQVILLKKQKEKIKLDLSSDLWCMAERSVCLRNKHVDA